MNIEFNPEEIKSAEDEEDKLLKEDTIEVDVYEDIMPTSTTKNKKISFVNKQESEYLATRNDTERDLFMSLNATIQDQ